MALSSRKEKILQAIVDDYIESAQPISSAEIQEKHLPELSTATIRNELSALEEMGYLAQPHTSAGRIPTAEAYRLYVDSFMPHRKLSGRELRIIKSNFRSDVRELKDIMSKTAKVLTEITNLTSVAFVRDNKDAYVKSIKFVNIYGREALVVIVTDAGILNDVTITVEGDFEESYYEAVSKFATAVFAGYRLGDIIEEKKIIDNVVKEYTSFIKSVIRILKRYGEQLNPEQIVLEGSSKILEQPEFSNIDKARAMLKILDAKQGLIPILKPNSDMSVSIQINRDNELAKGSPECAVVTATYSIGGKSTNAGVIGPTRMDYPKVVSVLSYIAKTINALQDGTAGELEQGQDQEEE